MGDLTGWLAALIAMGSLWWTVRRDQWKDGTEAMNARTKPVETDVKKHTEAIVRLETKMDAHEAQDNDRFEAIGQMFAEIRGDIKELLRR